MRCLSLTRQVCLVGVKVIIVILVNNTLNGSVAYIFILLMIKMSDPLFSIAPTNSRVALAELPSLYGVNALNLHVCLVYNTHVYRNGLDK